MEPTQTKFARPMTGFLPSIILLLLMLSIAYTWQNGSDYKIDVSIPFNANGNLLQSNLIKKVAEEIRLYPHAEIYVVFQPGNSIHVNSKLTYNRKKTRLTKTSVYSGGGSTSWWNNVTDVAIVKAAKDSARFNDMENYGCKNGFQ